MKIIYIIFFIILNFLIFTFLTKKVKINFRIKIALAIVLFVIVTSHFFDLMGGIISDKLFMYSMIASFSLFLFHFASNVAVWFGSKTHGENESFNLGVKWFNFWKSYIIYFMILILQIATIIKN